MTGTAYVNPLNPTDTTYIDDNEEGSFLLLEHL